jgi:hypothetical protein
MRVLEWEAIENFEAIFSSTGKTTLILVEACKNDSIAARVNI